MSIWAEGASPSSPRLLNWRCFEGYCPQVCRFSLSLLASYTKLGVTNLYLRTTHNKCVIVYTIIVGVTNLYLRTTHNTTTFATANAAGVTNLYLRTTHNV